MATNYHVVSSAIHFPGRYRVECIRHDGSLGILKIIDVDVIHDLAITKTDEDYDSSLALGESAMEKGTRIFSFAESVSFPGDENGLLIIIFLGFLVKIF